MPTFGSLFSGGGGWDVGAIMAGLEPAFSVEMHEPTARVLIRNLHAFRGHATYIGSVLDADPSTFPKVDILASSPPLPSALRRSPARGSM